MDNYKCNNSRVNYYIWFKIFRPNEEDKEKISSILSYNFIYEYYYEDDKNGSTIKNFTINETGNYQICVFGASAIKGGKGGIVCCEHSFEIGNIIDFYFEGRTAGGVGGKNCGFRGGNAYDGAGLGKAVLRGHENEFKIIAGGGGGSSENDYNKGGNAEENGAGINSGKGATINSAGKKGDSYAKDGYKFHGGEGGQYRFCGGGGGNGYYGGGGGGGGFFESNASGGGGGSNLYYSKKECKPYYNDNNYSGVSLKKL